MDPRVASNAVLRALPDEERAGIARDLDIVSIGIRDTVMKAREPISNVYFPVNNVMSMIVEMEEGETIEVGTVGKEGMVGSPLVLGARCSNTTVFCQVPGEAARMNAERFKEHLDVAPAFNRLLHRYVQSLMTQMGQTAACNHAHPVEQRACRWLLMTHDRVGVDDFPLTQEFLAQMLGVRRPSVTVAAGMLQKAGLIRYVRGRVSIVDRAGLEAAACECYRIVKKEQDDLVGQ